MAKTVANEFDQHRILKLKLFYSINLELPTVINLKYKFLGPKIHNDKRKICPSKINPLIKNAEYANFCDELWSQRNPFCRILNRT